MISLLIQMKRLRKRTSYHKIKSTKDAFQNSWPKILRSTRFIKNGTKNNCKIADNWYINLFKLSLSLPKINHNSISSKSKSLVGISSCNEPLSLFFPIDCLKSTGKLNGNLKSFFISFSLSQNSISSISSINSSVAILGGCKFLTSLWLDSLYDWKSFWIYFFNCNLSRTENLSLSFFSALFFRKRSGDFYSWDYFFFHKAFSNYFLFASL